jgi:OOP family OmpA-OmpF porin
MRRRITLILSIALGLVLPARRAAATDCAGPLSPCINDDTLWPHAGPAQFESVGSTETVARHQLGFGLVADYLSRPIVFKLSSPGGGSTQYAINDQVNGTFLWSYGVTDRLELDFVLPVTFGQGGAGLAPVTGGGGLHDTALRDIRFGFAYALVPSHRPVSLPDAPGSSGGLAARFEVSAPTGDRDQFAGDRTGVFVPSLAADVRVGPLFGGAEVGARIRPPTQLLGARVGTQIVTSLGVGVDILPHRVLSGVLEAWALETVVGQENAFVQNDTLATRSNGTVLVPSEWQLSARTAPLADGDFTIQVGGGGAIPWSGEGVITTPRFRFVLGVRWAPLGRGPQARPESPAAPPDSLLPTAAPAGVPMVTP